VSATIAVVVYCPRCDYFLKIALRPDAIGTHGCTQCNGQMEVYVAYRGADHTWRPPGADTSDTIREAPSDLTSEQVAANLRAAVKASGLTQQQVAERADMDPTALSKALSGKRRVSSLELALICTATGSDVLAILGADPLHGPSYRAGIAEAERRVGIVHLDPDGDYTGCGAHEEGQVYRQYCDLPTGHGGPHHAHLYWESSDRRAPHTGQDES